MCHTRYRASEQTRLPRLFQIPCIAGFFLSAVALRGGGYNEVAKQGWYRLTKDPCTSSHFFGSLCEGFFVYTKAEMPESGQRGLSVEQAAQAYGGSNPSLSTMKIKIEELIKLNPLIWPNQPDIVVNPNHSNIFLGGGVATKNQISRSVPFDLLGFMLTAEQMNRLTKGEIHLLIADQHAWLANQINQDEAKLATQKLKDIISNIITCFKLKDWSIHLASEIFPGTTESNYETLETRDINLFTTNHGVGIKIGWTFSPKEIGITDESHFDTLHNLPTILIKPGLTSDPAKPHESPYICTDPTTRIVFGTSNNWDVSPAVKNHLRNICLLFENLIEPFPPKTPRY